MKRVGVVTFSNAVDNYGQVLQYIATQEFLRSHGYYASLLIPTGHRVRDNWCSRVVRFCRRARQFASRFASRFKNQREMPGVARSKVDELEVKKNAEFKRWMDSIDRNEKVHPRFFNDFKNRYFSTFKGTYEDILEHGFKYFCVGSDQIWGAPSECFLLDWVPEDCTRFSISPSVGCGVVKDGALPLFKKNLPKFKFITVRESNGIELCKRAGFSDAKVALDPTFLLTATDYDKYSIPTVQEKPYALLYFLGGEVEVEIGDIIRFCRERGLEVVYVASQGREDEFPKCYARVGEWLSLMRGATYVFTNSFHGMAFSIIYHKQFLVFQLTGIMNGMNGRVLGLSQRMKLQDRLYSTQLEKVADPIDWEAADHEITNNRIMLNDLMKGII